MFFRKGLVFIANSLISTDYNMKELAEHGTKEFPILICCGFTLSSDIGIVSWHWHENFELTYVESGHLEFYVGSDTFILNPGEAIFINSKILHQVKPVKDESPVYYSYTFSPELLTESMHSLIATKYIIPLMHNYHFPYYTFHNKVHWEKYCLSHIHMLNHCASTDSFVRELKVKHYLQQVFIDMIDNMPEICTKTDYSLNNENYSIMKIMHYIKEHYSEVISLEDLANVANISKSSCNRLFHKTLKMTPFKYLLDYRINQSMQLLKNGNKTISEIAYCCGFRDVSYYCKMFRKLQGISPQQYRNNYYVKKQPNTTR